MMMFVWIMIEGFWICGVGGLDVLLGGGGGRRWVSAWGGVGWVLGRGVKGRGFGGSGVEFREKGGCGTESLLEYIELKHVKYDRNTCGMI